MPLTKIDDRGLNTPIDLLDNEKIRLGTGNDLEIYHDGSHHYILSSNGHIHIVGDGTNQVKITAKNNEQGILITPDASVELYYDNSKKLETYSGGVQITGNVYIPDGSNSGNYVGLGNAADLRIFHDGTNSFIQNSTAALIFRSDQYRFRDKDDGDTFANFIHDGAVELYHDNSKRLQTEAWGTRVFATGYDTKLAIQGEENRSCELQFQADDGDDYADYSKIHKNKDTGKLHIQNYASGSWEDNIVCHNNAQVELFYDNNKKFETLSTGAGVTGDLALSGELNMTTGGNYNRFIDASLDDGEALFLRSTNGGDANHQNMAIFHRAGASELYYAAAKKFETTSSGIQVTGQVYTDTAHVNGELDLVGHLDLNSDNHRIKLGAGDDFQLYHDGSNNYITTNNGDIIMQTTGDDIQLLAQDDITLKVQGGVETAINCVGNGAVELYHDNGLKFFTGANGIYFPNHGTLHEKAIHFEVGQNTGQYGTLFGVTNYPDHGGYNNQSAGHWARIQSAGGCVVIINSDASNRNDGRNGFDHFSVYQRAGESTNGKRLFSVDGDGSAQFGRAGIRIDNAWGAQPSITVQRNNNDNTDNTNDGAYMRVHGIGETHESWTGASPGSDFSVNFIIDGSTYATSDRRAKTDIVDCPYGLDVVNKLQPRKFQLVNSALTPQGDDNINLGFIAQEIKEHIPECVNYLGDEANTPNEKGWARAYALDIGEVIPVLTKAIQELSDKVKTLETKVAALEAK